MATPGPTLNYAVIGDGALTVLTGPEDLVIQYTYGRQLARAYRRKYGSGKADYVKYSGKSGAGHGVMVQHPKWTQKKIDKALAATD